MKRHVDVDPSKHAQIQTVFLHIKRQKALKKKKKKKFIEIHSTQLHVMHSISTILQ